MTLLLLFMACDKSLQDTGLDFASCSACSLIDPQNYGLDSEISAETWKLPAQTDVSVDWSERIADGQTVISWSTAGVVDIVRPDGVTVWRLALDLGAAFGFIEHRQDLGLQGEPISP